MLTNTKHCIYTLSCIHTHHTCTQELTKLNDEDGTGFVSPGTSPTAKTAMLKKTGTLRPTGGAAAAVPAAVTKRQMLTWEVLKDQYGVATYHMVDNKNYSGIVITQNMLVKVRRYRFTHTLRIRKV
jgi:hypothetical protein